MNYSARMTGEPPRLIALVCLAALVLSTATACETMAGLPAQADVRLSSVSVAVRTTERREAEIEAVEHDIIERVNAFRAAHNRAPLVHHPVLSSVAREHSRDMAARGFYGHADPDGVTPNERVARVFARTFLMAGTAENIAYREQGGRAAGSPVTADLGRHFMEGWINSPGHRANLLREEMTLIGVGVAVSGGRVFATQKFMDYLAEIVDPEPGAVLHADDPRVTLRVNLRRVRPERFVVRVNLPDPRARWELPDRRYYSGFGFLDAEWTSADHVVVELPVDRYGPGTYSLQFGDRGGHSTYDRRVEYTVRGGADIRRARS